MAKKILFIGALNGTSLHRKNAFERIGFNVTAIDPRSLLPKSVWIDRFEWHIAPSFLSAMLYNKFCNLIKDKFFDLVFIDNGSLISKSIIKKLRLQSSAVVNFNHDDPFGSRDRIRFSAYRNAVAEYDLIVVVRKQNISEAYALGAKKVLFSYRTADEIAHAPRLITDEIYEKWKSDVVFVGTWMPERGPFMLRLIELQVPLTIYGSGWEKAKEWNVLKGFHKGNHLDGDEYSYAIQCAKINLGLLSKGNRDLHTTRSMEIPMMGGVLCAERTEEHLYLYEDGKEALFWNDADECALICNKYLSDSAGLNDLKVRSKLRSDLNHNTSEFLIRSIFSDLLIEK